MQLQKFAIWFSKLTFFANENLSFAGWQMLTQRCGEIDELNVYIHIKVYL